MNNLSDNSVFVKLAKAISPKNHSWVYNLNSEDEDAFAANYLAQISSRLRDNQTAVDSQIEALKAEARTAKVQTMAVLEIHKQGLNVGDPITQPEIYAKRVNGLLCNPAFSGANWQQDERGEMFPVDKDGYRKTDVFNNPLGLSELVTGADVYQTMPGEDHPAQPATQTVNSYDTYQRKKKLLLGQGRHKEVSQLSREYLETVDAQ